MHKPSASEVKGAAVREYGKNVDFGRTSDDYARFRPGPPASFYDRVERVVPLRGAVAVDIGTGTGLAAIEMAKRGAKVIGVDPSEEQLAAAAHAAGVAQVPVEFRVGKAEALPLVDETIDLYMALQCWHWFDPVKAGAEALRVLKKGGVAMAASFDYLPRRSRVAGRTEELILKYNPGWPAAGGQGVHLNPMQQLPDAGFVDVEQAGYEHVQVFTHEAWRGRMRTCNGVGASLPAEKVAAFDAELAGVLAREFSEELRVEHRVWMVWGRKAT
jgi:SAM-dependent methyltransferase